MSTQYTATVLPFYRKPGDPVRSAVTVYKENRDASRKRTLQSKKRAERLAHNAHVLSSLGIYPSRKPTRFPLLGPGIGKPPRPDGPGAG